MQEGSRRAALEQLRSLGYRYVTLDLAGYRMGSLNDGLEIGEQQRGRQA
jgi:PP-loop superfamily ATP-utilizing enzyme